MKKNNIYKFIAIIFLVMFSFNTIVLGADTTNCNSYGDLKQDLQNVFNLVKIIVPLLVLGLSTVDFIKAVTAKDEKDTKKAFMTLLKRIVYAIILFILPMLINLLLDLFDTGSNVCNRIEVK